VPEAPTITMADNGVLAFLVALHESAAGTRFPDAGGITVTAQEDPTSVEDRLRAIQSITDAALSRLDDHDLLAKLLDRTRDALQADTAAVLLLDSPSGQLIATATAGLEEEVRQRLCRAVTAELPDTVCSAVMGALVGNEPARDDIALLMIRSIRGQ